jgi:putative aldouronate transport system permease protein
MYGLTLAFKDFKLMGGILGSPWVGLKYFKQLFGQGQIWQPLFNTLIINSYKLIFAFPIPIIIALLLNEMLNQKIKRVFQTFLYLPHFISWVIVGGLFATMMSLHGGILNEIVKSMGFEPVSFLIRKDMIRGIIVLSHIWKSAGWGSIIYLAALSNINPELYEAAKIDGAGRLRQIISITLPGIKSIIVIMLILSIGNMMRGNFEHVIVFENPLVREKIDILQTFVYRNGILSGRYSYAAAAGFFNSVVSFIVVVSADKASKKMGEEGLL